MEGDPQGTQVYALFHGHGREGATDIVEVSVRYLGDFKGSDLADRPRVISRGSG